MDISFCFLPPMPLEHIADCNSVEESEELKILEDILEMNIDNFLDQSSAMSSFSKQHQLFRIRVLAVTILEKINSIKSSGCPLENSEKIIDHVFERLEKVEDQFSKNNRLYSQEKEKTTEEFKKISEKIQNTELDFSSFGLQETSQSPSTMEGYRRAKMEENIALATVFGTVIDGVNTVFSETLKQVGAGISNTTKAFCQLNPTTRQVCTNVEETTTNAVNALFNQADFKSFCQKFSELVLFEPHALSQEIQNQFQIPQNVSTQYSLNGFNIGLALFPFGTIGKAGKTGLKTLRTSEALKTPSRIAIAIQTKSEIEKRAVAKLKETKALINPPKDYPLHLNQFLHKCEVHHFKTINVGETKRSTIEGHLLYKPMENHIFFLFAKSISLDALKTRVPSNLIKATSRLTADERLDLVFENAVKLVKEKNLKKAFFCWDPNNSNSFNVVSLMEKRSEKILSFDTFSAGLHSKPYNVIEVEIL